MVAFFESVLDFFNQIINLIHGIVNDVVSFFTLLPRAIAFAATAGGMLPLFITGGIAVVVSIFVVKIILDLL